MGYEKINRVTVKKDGVYISSKSSNDSMPFRSCKIDFLTDEYNKNGETGLVKALFYLFTDNCVPYGWHRSIEPFRSVLSYYYAPYKKVYDNYLSKINNAWDILSDKDKGTRWNENKTSAMKEYLEKEKRYKEEYIDDLCSLYWDKRKEN